MVTAAATGLVDPLIASSSSPDEFSAPPADSPSAKTEIGERTGARYSDEIVVTATAGERGVGEVPAVISSEERVELVERRLARTLPDAMNELPGVAVQKTSNGQASPYLRGFTGFRTLLLVDGVRLNNSVFRDGPNEYWGLVDLHAAERLEVVLGPGSALYGSDAIGGTAAVLTSEPPGDGAEPGGAFVTRGASAERSGIGHASAHGTIGGGFGWSLGGTFGELGDVAGGGDVGRQEMSGYGFEAVDFKGRWRIGAERLLTVAHQRSRLDDVWRTHATVFGVSWRGTSVGSDLERSFDFARELTYVQLVDTGRRAFADSLWASLSWQELGEEHRRTTASGRRELAGVDVGTAGVQLRLTKSSPIGFLTYGADVYRDRVDSDRSTLGAGGALLVREVQGPVADESKYETAGVYAQDEVQLSSRWSLVGGLRYSRTRLDAGAFEDPETESRAALRRSWSATVGHLRALVRLGETERWRAWVGWGQAFRAPNLSDLTRLDLARSGELETASPDLAPERFATVELGMRFAEQRGDATLAYYETDVDGMIVRVPTGATVNGMVEVTKRNAGKGRIRGVDVAGERALGDAWRFRFAACWLEGAIDGYPSAEPEHVREPLDKAMAPWGLVALAWEMPGGDGWLEVALHRTEAQERLSSRDLADSQRIPPSGSPGYTLWSVRGGWSLERLGRISLAVENLSDAEYRVHGSGVNGPGRNLIATFATEF